MTFRANCVVLIRFPPLPVTVTVETLLGIDALVVIFMFMKQVGVHWVVEKAAVAPAGSPAVEKETG